jgi:hypothetical protein
VLLALDPSSHRRVGREEVGRLFDPDFFRDCAERVSEGFNRFLRFEDVEDAETVWALSGRVYEQAVEGQSDGASIRVVPVRRRTTSSYLSRVRLGV